MIRTFHGGIVAQSGGPSAVINSTLVAIIEEAKRKNLAWLHGSLNGPEGIDKERFVDLFMERDDILNRVARTPCSALGSSRRKIGREEGQIAPERIFEVLKKRDARYFFYIGGNDSAGNALEVSRIAMHNEYELYVFHVPKTIDNDLMENDHTHGYRSAAKFVALATLGDNLDNLSLPGVKINVIMGRSAGFLAAGSGLARRNEDDAPHLIYFPERVFNIENFLRDVEGAYKRYGRAVVSVSEGIEDKKGVPIGWNGKKDSHDNYELEGQLVANRLTELVRKAGIKRVRADVFGYLQRSFPGIVSSQDRREALAVGARGVREAVKGEHQSGSISLMRKPGGKYDFEMRVVPLEAVAKGTRRMPDEFINEEGNYVTQAFLDYVSPLFGKLPEMGRLEMHFVKFS